MSTLFNATAAAIAASRAETQFVFLLTIDGERGVYPEPGTRILASGNWSQIPFITGENKDEGTAFVPAPQYITAGASKIWLAANLTPLFPYTSERLVEYERRKLLELCPNDPAVGATFGTGCQTWNLNPEYKRLAALRE
jgi:carboxylesterase type B